MRKSIVLIVDDNPANRDICKIGLESLNVSTCFAENGKIGLMLAESMKPDLILLDIMMPVMDGFEMLEKLKQHSIMKDIPVLILTARSGTEDVVRALELGANDYIKKPFDEEEMMARANTLIKNRRMEKQLREDLAAGAVIQKKFLISKKEIRKIFNLAGMDVNIFNLSYTSISGDFFYSNMIGDHCVGFFFGDTCGHGLSAAMISMRVLGLLQIPSQRSCSPETYLSNVNADICGVLPQGRFIAGSYIIFNRDSIHIANAGQPAPIMISGNIVQEIDLVGYPLGVYADVEFSGTMLDFTPGDQLVLYSDGVTGAANIEGEHFGKERFLACLKESASMPLSKFIHSIEKRLNQFMQHAPPKDDMTVIVIEKQEMVRI